MFFVVAADMLLAWLPEAECLAALQQYSLEMPSNILLLIRSESLYLNLFFGQKKIKIFFRKEVTVQEADLAFVCVWGERGVLRIKCPIVAPNCPPKST